MAIIWFIFIIFPCHCAVYMYKIMILQKPQPISTKFHIDPSVEMWLIVSSNDAPLTVRPIYSSSRLRTAQMMIFSLVAMTGLEKCCITSACLQWLCHSGERTVARGPLVLVSNSTYSVHPEHCIIQESAYLLHHFTCQGDNASVWGALVFLGIIKPILVSSKIKFPLHS